MTKNEELPKVTPEQREKLDHLSAVDIKLIDQALLSNVATEWSRTDRVVLATMIELDNGMGLPNSYFVERMEHLVGEGLLEAQGDLTHARSSEVRLKR